jgi:outer membrane protein TolC
MKNLLMRRRAALKHSNIPRGVYPISLAVALLVWMNSSAGQTVRFDALKITLTTRDSLKLEDCLNYAREGNPDLRLSALEVQMAHAQKMEVMGQRLPSIGFGAGYTRLSESQRLIPAGIPNEPGVFGREIINGDLSLGLPLFTGGKITAEISQASQKMKASVARLERARQEISFSVTSVFYGILSQNRRLQSVRFARDSLLEHQKRVEELLAAGKAAKVDLLKIQVRLADLNYRIIREEDLLKRQKLLLLNLMGMPLDPDSLALADDPAAVLPDRDLNWSLDQVYQMRSDFLSLQSLREAQARKLASVKAVRLPVISTFAGVGVKWMPQAEVVQYGAEETDLLVKGGINLNLPLFQGGQISSRIQQQQIALQELDESLIKLRLQIRMEVESAWNAFRAAQARFAAGEVSVEQAQEAYQIEQEKFLLGKGTMVEVLDAQSALLEAESNYFSALSDLQISSAQLDLALGLNR